MKLLLRCMSLEVAPFGSVAQFPRCLQIDLKRASRQGPCWSENEPDRTLHCYSLAAEYKNSATTALLPNGAYACVGQFGTAVAPLLI